MKRALSLLLVLLATLGTEARNWPGFERGMGIGGWMTNYKRFNVLPENRRLVITTGDLEHFDTYITKKDIAYIGSMGLDHIRVGFDQIVVEESPYVYRERIFRKLDEFIGWCEKYHLNIVLNLHKAIGNYCDIQENVQLLDNEELQNRFVALWLEFERRYHQKSKIAFELMNEIRDVNPEKWNKLADRTLKAIREKNPNRWVVIGSTCWNSPDKLKYLHVYNDPYVVYTFHNYAPFEFTHQQGVLQADPLYYNRKMDYPSTDMERYRDYERVVHGNNHAYANIKAIDKEFLRGILQPAFDFVRNNPDAILWAGEFGTIRHARMECREAWMADMISLLKENGIPYCVWNYLSTPNDGNRFSLIDDDNRKILSKRMLKIIQGKRVKLK